jgi:hypothetical protein
MASCGVMFILSFEKNLQDDLVIEISENTGINRQALTQRSLWSHKSKSFH